MRRRVVYQEDAIFRVRKSVMREASGSDKVAVKQKRFRDIVGKRPRRTLGGRKGV